ncbi:MAG TPA: UDP-3-O-acyl-N-acetylglucosamine deacetylase [Deltaproteobacteria bacterium]|nr:UDP-3-O-acyl-N-acetylglucosamine deacetylase [Deltaproteobacteria bacterium]HRW81164.1 UDP-3-O-acyl-N-acetylglucosamine deacetylase [Desulfomonilia bacterium]HNS90086.1 UDP-3-O-acyl-N-acetylglucosamine deacetylase [Deltaproteobacteria bacterium]HOA45045.1 UDP-3-O-acyl-N-acetylglucosamine deacetylase [Deltaproteobacteria bacterium]HOG84771.1 UDP-3-O-acyl-N-acetylglucosamine deacetylase [Deltaproteobacteria bacterium]
MERRTIREEVMIEGTGIHSGSTVTVHLRPASGGIVFIRAGLRIPACPVNVIDTRLNTTIGSGSVRISTIEHLMAALYGAGITDCDIEVSGDEIPAMDGSALPFVRLLRDTGTACLGLVRTPIDITGAIRVEDGISWIEAVPGDFSLSYEIDFPDAAIGKLCYTFAGTDFPGEIAPARTFGRMQDVETMRSAGLALGGGLHNAVVVDGERVLNPEGLRFPDEFVRHKVLDLLGDLWTLQAPLNAGIRAYRANHTLHIRLARFIFERMQG